MGVTATRRLQYAIGHRVHGHEGKCRHLHGHNFVFFLTAEAAPSDDECGQCMPDGLDSIGRVIDFGVLKERLGGWLEHEWDHGFVVWEKDDEALDAIRRVADQKYFMLDTNPTAENLARYVLDVVGPRLLAGTGVRLVRVVVHETENGIAEATL